MEKKTPLFNFSCHLCNLLMRSYSQLQSGVPFRVAHEGSVSFKALLSQVARPEVVSRLAPAMGRHVLAWGWGWEWGTAMKGRDVTLPG